MHIQNILCIRCIFWNVYNKKILTQFYGLMYLHTCDPYVSRRTETRHSFVGSHHSEMMSAERFVVEWLFQIHDTLDGVHVKEFGRVLRVRLNGVGNHLIHTGIVVVGLNAQNGRSERRTLGHRYVVAVVLDLGRTIVDVLHQHRNGNLGGHTGHTVRCPDDQLVVLFVLIVEFVDDVNGTCVGLSN